MVLGNTVYTIGSQNGSTWVYQTTDLSLKEETDGQIESLNGVIESLTKRISDLEVLINAVGLQYTASTDTVEFGKQVKYPL